MALNMDYSILATIKNKHSRFLPERFTQARILVVDDIPINVKLICSILMAAGYTKIETAHDGIDALKKTYRFEPDLVLLDIMMPVLDGFGYCERIRSDPGAIRMPIIMQTALNEREAKLRALSTGADDFLNKPLDPEELLLRVHVHLERYFMFQDLDQIRSYLKMELDQAQTTIKWLKEGKGEQFANNLLGKHYEVLETLTKEARTDNNT
jgi:sigma-B regulation protein RsbU (phosphoserine phosphatase)